MTTEKQEYVKLKNRLEKLSKGFNIKQNRIAATNIQKKIDEMESEYYEI